MSKIIAKILVTFVFLLLSALPYVGPVFLVLCALWGLWVVVLLVGLVKKLWEEGFEESEFQDNPN